MWKVKEKKDIDVGRKYNREHEETSAKVYHQIFNNVTVYTQDHKILRV